MDKKLPIYRASISDDEAGMFAISLVDEPAVESNFLYFSEDKRPMVFSIQDEEKRIVRGVVMEADKLIYRRDETGFEYYITFDADTIRLMAQKYLRDGFSNNVDTMHNGNLEEGVEMVQWFISDKEHGVNPEGFENIADHSLFAEFHVINDTIWEEIKAGTYKGFSLAGIFEAVPVEMRQVNEPEKDDVLGDIQDLLEKINNKLR